MSGKNIKGLFDSLLMAFNFNGFVIKIINI